MLIKKRNCSVKWNNYAYFQNTTQYLPYNSRDFSFQVIQNDEILMKTVLAKLGPIIVSLNGDVLQTYTGGIINNASCSVVYNHNALAVGYGTDPITALDYYLVKNSWGNAWG